MTAAEHTLRPDFHLIVIPHDLDHWELPDRSQIERIETVWLFDKNSHTHCCELTPSYELWPVATRIIPKFECADDETLRERLGNLAADNSDDEVAYYHVRTVDRWLAGGKATKALGDFNGIWGVEAYEDVSYSEQRDNVLEYCRGNEQL